MLSKTCRAPVNIAVVKYWGKRDEKLILPVNASLSATLHQDQLCAKTTVAASKLFTSDRMWLNGIEQSMEGQRIQKVLEQVRRRARKRHIYEDNSATPLLNWHIHICSENNFPTAAGLASSAAGLACLVFSLAKLYNLDGDISEIARQGSGSACRSVYGGFVEWTLGSEEDGSDSVAKQIAPEDHWPEMRVLILVVSGKKKPVGSTAGMQTSVKTSDLLQHRIKHVVPTRMKLMRQAILDKDFHTFADLTIKDSNQMHAVCLDTFPPISYLTDTSRDIIRIIHAINSLHEHPKVAYTFDAGPNACLYLLESDVALVLGVIKHFFSPSTSDDNFFRGLESPSLQPVSQELLDAIPVVPSPGQLQYVIHTKVGPGPQEFTDDEESLLKPDGMPKFLAC